MVEWIIHHSRLSRQFDPKVKRVVGLTFYVKSKPGKCKAFEGDRIFVIGIKNHLTDNFEEFACTEEEWFLVLELMCSNDLRLNSQRRYVNRLRKLADMLEKQGAEAFAKSTL